MNKIEIKNLTKKYGNKKGIFDLSLQVKQGEVIGLLGANGAGKTTLIRHLLGFIRPKTGECLISGMDCFVEAKSIQNKLGYLPGEIAFFGDMTGKGFLRFMAQLKGIRDLTYMNQLIERFQLDPKGKIHRMSKGMKQKIALVCAFMGKPDILILDEPTSGLDPLMQGVFIDLILEEKQRGATIFMASHIFEEVEKTCDKVAMIREGNLISVENIKDLKKSRKKIYEVVFTDETVAQVFVSSYEDAYEVDGKVVSVAVRGNITPLIQALSKHEVVSLEERKQTLEELFLHYYGGQNHEE